MFTLRRSGSFYGFPTGCCHCGPDDKPREYQYSYAITVYNFGLDEQGFVLDNQKPQVYFDSFKDGFSESCELLARKTAFEFASWCSHPYHVTVCITGFETAAAEYSFYCESLPFRCFRLMLDYLYGNYVGIMPLRAWRRIDSLINRCSDSISFILDKVLR